MAPFCGGDDCEEYDYSENPLTIQFEIGNGKEKENPENMAYEFGYGLELLISRATNIDELTGAFLPTRRRMKSLYSVVMGIKNGPTFKTRVTVGDWEPVWDQQFNVLLNESTVCGFLDLEIVDEKHSEDPRTSHGRVVVGRARILLPEDFGVTKSMRKVLVKEAGDGKKLVGFIYLTWRLSKVHARDIIYLD